ncbi:MAG: hypothetical protein IKU44_05295 [Firmicutes bacterium]|nr:hypothetical protein [Bacillota bacterium]
MDKLLCMLGMGIVVGFIRIREWFYGITDMLQGADGFVTVIGICLVALVLAVGVMLVGRCKRV